MSWWSTQGLPSSSKHCIFNMSFSFIIWRINYLNLWDTFTSPTNVLILFLKLYILKIPKYKCFFILTGICFFLQFYFCVGYLASKPIRLLRLLFIFSDVLHSAWYLSKTDVPMKSSQVIRLILATVKASDPLVPILILFFLLCNIL